MQSAASIGPAAAAVAAVDVVVFLVLLGRGSSNNARDRGEKLNLK
jgi:hypothetical protein